jgi:HEAT repeat protein
MPEATPPTNADERAHHALAPDTTRRVAAVARALVAAARSWALYPPEHPAVRTSLDRLRAALADAAAGQTLSFGITPDTLLVDGAPAAGRADRIEGPVAEAAAWLHQRDIVQLSFAPELPPQALQQLLALLVEDPAALRDAGGPAKAWAERGNGAIVIEQIDFDRVLADREVQHPARKKDDLWRAIVRAVIDRRKTLDETIQRRLLEIAGDSIAIGELAQDVMAPNHAADGSPMLTTQAAAVVAAYRHLVGIVDVMAPDRRAEVMQNLAAATANLDPRVVIEMLNAPDDPGAAGAVDVKAGLASAFDDVKVAQLLATTLAIDGQASERLADVFDTIAPDEPRKRRVLTLTRTLLSETTFGRGDQFHSLWSSMEELLLTYNEKPFVSGQYKAGLDQIGARAEQMAASDLPPELAELVHTLEQDNVRRLSVILLIDLLKLERDPARAPELARDVAALAEDLLLAGDYASALEVTRALAEQAVDPQSVASQGSRVALDGLVQTAAFVETVELLGQMSDEGANRFAAICREIGPAAADGLRDLLDTEEPARASERARPVLLGVRAVSRVAPLVSSPHWYAQRNAAALLGEIGVPEGVPLLQPLLRGADPRVMRAAVQALSNIDDPAAARAIHTVLRAAAGEQRRAVVAALVAERDPRVVPVLVRILTESDPLGADHVIVLETLGAIGEVGDDQAVAPVAGVMRRRSWLARKKVRAVKISSLEALRRIGSPAAVQAVEDAAANGDRLLKKLAKAAMAAPVAHG